MCSTHGGEDGKTEGVGSMLHKHAALTGCCGASPCGKDRSQSTTKLIAAQLETTVSRSNTVPEDFRFRRISYKCTVTRLDAPQFVSKEAYFSLTESLQ